MKRKPYKTDRKFKNDRACSLDEVAKELGVSIERVRVIESDALKKCKDWCNANGMDMELMLQFLRADQNRIYTLHDAEPESAES